LAIDKKKEQKVNVAEMKMLRWMSVVKRKDRMKKIYVG